MLKADQLRDLYGEPSERAVRKELTTLDVHARNFIERSPFLVLSTCDRELNMDASPRGGIQGFVHVRSNNELLIPDAKGNNRLDSLRNIRETGKVGLLFLIPGIDETLRVNGSASISIATEHLELFNTERIPPKACLVVQVEQVFLHCAKAFMRSKLWSESAQVDPTTMPSMGEMLKDQLKLTQEPESRSDMIERYRKDI